MRRFVLLAALTVLAIAEEHRCPKIKRSSCCTADFLPGCVSKHCIKWIQQHCPERRAAVMSRGAIMGGPEIRRAPVKVEESASCGTAEKNYQPCTSKNIANKLFHSCCSLYVPEECHFMCQYETDQNKTRAMLIDLVTQKRCSLKYLSSVLYCASQNRDNRRCCADLDLNAPQLQVGSRCLRMCDPSGTAIEKITKEDVTCLYNWNVIMYCHHGGIREM